MTAYTAWTRRRAITVTNGSGSTITNAALELLLTVANFTFALAQADGDDLRFEDAAGTTPLSYCLDSFDAVAQTAIVNVRIPSLPVGATVIYLYYGNSLAASESSWDGVFRAGVAAPTSQVIGNLAAMNAFPSSLKLANGDILTFWSQGASDGATDTVTYMRRSTDLGATWSAPVLMFSNATYGIGAQEGALQLASGTILLTFSLFPADGTTARIARSTDNGATFTTPAVIAPPAGYLTMQFYGPMTELTPGGTLWATAYAHSIATGRFESLLLQSTDAGVTWTLRSVIAANGSLAYSETAVYRASATHAVAIIREDNGTTLHYARSTDDGLTWTAPVRFMPGHVSPTLKKLSTGELVLLAGDRGQQVMGIGAWISGDDGLTFSHRSQPVGAVYPTISQTGYPSPVEVSPGVIGFASYDNRAGANASYIYWTTMTVAYLQASWFEGFETSSENDLAYKGGAGLSVGAGPGGGTALHILDTDPSIPEVVDYLNAGTTGDLVVRVHPIVVGNGVHITLNQGPSVDPAMAITRFELSVEAGGLLKYYNGAAWVALPTPTTLTLNAWHRLRLRWSGNACEVQVNGVSKGTIGQYQAGGAPTHWHVGAASGSGVLSDAWWDGFAQQPYLAVLPTLSYGAEETPAYPGSAIISAAARGSATVSTGVAA